MVFKCILAIVVFISAKITFRRQICIENKIRSLVQVGVYGSPTPAPLLRHPRTPQSSVSSLLYDHSFKNNNDDDGNNTVVLSFVAFFLTHSRDKGII